MSEQQAGHDHTHSMTKQTLRLAFFLTILIVAAQVVGGLREKHRIGHTTFQFECSGRQGTCRDSDGLYCSMEEQEDLHDHRHEHTEKQDVSTERMRERQ